MCDVFMLWIDTNPISFVLINPEHWEQLVIRVLLIRFIDFIVLADVVDRSSVHFFTKCDEVERLEEIVTMPLRSSRIFSSACVRFLRKTFTRKVKTFT